MVDGDGDTRLVSGTCQVMMVHELTVGRAQYHDDLLPYEYSRS